MTGTARKTQGSIKSPKVPANRPPVVMFLAKAFQRGEGSTPRAKQEAEALLKAGYPVYVLAWDRKGEVPDFENVDGTFVHSFNPLKLRRFSRLQLGIGGMIFMILLTFHAVRLVGQLKKRPIIHAHDINTLPIGCLLKALRLCCGLVYDCREFTYGVYYEWFNSQVASLVRVVEESCLHYADVVITVSDSIAGYLRRFNTATEIVYNCPKAEEIPRLSKREARIQLGLPLEAFIVSSVGAIRPDCRFDLLLDVALVTQSRSIRYVVVGNGPLALAFRKDAKQAGANLTVLPAVPRRQALLYVLASDLTWAIYQNRPESMNPRMTLPWKFFESLACGVPVLVDPGTMRATLVNRFGCGIVLGSDHPDNVSRVIGSLAENGAEYKGMCLRAKDAADSSGFNWETMSVKLINVYSRLGTCGWLS